MASFDDITGMFDDYVKKQFGGTPAAGTGPAAPVADVQMPTSAASAEDLAAANRAARVARFGEEAVQRMEAAGARTANYFRGPSLNTAAGGTPPPAAPITAGAATGEAPGYGAKLLGTGRFLGRTLGGAAGVVGGALSIEDMLRSGVNVQNSLGLAASGLGTAAMVAPAAAPAAVGTGMLAAGTGLGYALTPDSIATRLASLFGRVGFGSKYAGGAGDITTPAGPETRKFIEAGKYNASPELRTALNLPAAAKPVTIDNATQQVIQTPTASMPTIDVNAPVEMPFMPPAGTPATVATPPVTGPTGAPTAPAAGTAPAAQAAGYGAKPASPKTGLPYSGMFDLSMNQSLADYFTNATGYIRSRGAESAYLRAQNAERTARVTEAKEQGATMRALLAKIFEPIKLESGTGGQVSVNQGTGMATSIDKTGRVTTQRIQSPPKPYSETNVRELIQQYRAQNPGTSDSRVRAALKQTYPDQDIPSAWFIAAK